MGKLTDQTMALLTAMEDAMRVALDVAHGDVPMFMDEAKRALYAAGDLCPKITHGAVATYATQMIETVAPLMDDVARLAKSGEDTRQYIDVICAGIDELRKKIKMQKRISVLFVPYKASMWDALESIWLAARDDERCEPIVMPVPYCDRGPDGAPIEWHYEGGIFPSYVPITDYCRYDMHRARPDIIYFHYPYDAGNSATAVDARYFSTELKKCTKMLVYVPYDVTNGYSMSTHFCRLPGVVHADRVIADSEPIRQMYLANYPDKSVSRAFLEKKFLALGSPKIDKVLHSKREDFEMPADWVQKLLGRKAILYNTHLTNVMMYPNEFLAKLRHVFQTFAARDDVVLWWRPHPLMMAVIQSLQPAAKEAYERMVAWYKSQDIGIYDETPDLHRAIACTDGYYGDEKSSVTTLYRYTKKPMMMQDLNVPENGRVYLKNGLPPYRGCAVIDGDVWLSEGWGGTLTQLDFATGEVKCVYKIPVTDPVGYVLASIGKTVFLVPDTGDCIIAFDCTRKAFSVTALAPDDHTETAGYDRSYGYLNLCTKGNTLFLLPYGRAQIVAYDSMTKTVTYHRDWFEKMRPLLQNRGQGIFNEQIAITDRWIACPVVQANTVFLFDYTTHDVQLVPISEPDTRVSALCYDGEKLWAAVTGRKELWIIRDTASTKILIEDDGIACQSNQALFSTIVSHGEYVYFLYSFTNKCLAVHKENFSITEMVAIREGIPNDLQNTAFHGLLFGATFRREMFLLSAGTHSFYKYDLVTGKLRRFLSYVDLQQRAVYDRTTTGYVWCEAAGPDRLEQFCDRVRDTQAPAQMTARHAGIDIMEQMISEGM